MRFAYACGDKKKQDFLEEVEVLKSTAPNELIIDKFVPGAKRPEGLDQLVSKLRKGDVLYFPSLKAVGKTARQLLSLINLLDQKGVHISFLAEGIESTTAQGESVISFVRALVSMDQSIRSESTAIGLRNHDAKPGPKKGSHDQERSLTAALQYKQGRPVKEVMENAEIKSRETLYRYLEIHGVARRNKRTK